MEKIVEKPFLGLRIVDIQSSSLQNEYKRLRYVYLKERDIDVYTFCCVKKSKYKKHQNIPDSEKGVLNGELEKNSKTNISGSANN